MFNKIRNAWIEHPSIDLAVVAAIVATHILVVNKSVKFDALSETGFANRLSIYTDLITVTGIFVGFTGAALASYLAVGGERMDDLRRRAGAQVTKQWLAVISGPTVAIAVLIVAKVFDRTNGGSANMRWAAEAAILLVVIRVCRMLYIYARLITIAMTPEFERSKRTRPIEVRKAG